VEADPSRNGKRVLIKGEILVQAVSIAELVDWGFKEVIYALVHRKQHSEDQARYTTNDPTRKSFGLQGD